MECALLTVRQLHGECGGLSTSCNACNAQVRFLLPVLPVFNIAAAAAVARIWNNRHKAAWLFASTAACLLVIGSICASTIMLAVSRHNYPGGHALHELHQWQASKMHGSQGPFIVHIDVLPAMTGVSRFGELGWPWTYSKVSHEVPVHTACNILHTCDITGLLALNGATHEICNV